MSHNKKVVKLPKSLKYLIDDPEDADVYKRSLHEKYVAAGLLETTLTLDGSVLYVHAPKPRRCRCIDKINAYKKMRRMKELEEALRNIANVVDEALLLDDALHQAWGELREAVTEARGVLGEKE